MQVRGDREFRLLVADAHPSIRAGLRLALERDGLTVCAEAADAEAAVEAALRERPDLCLLDVALPGRGLKAAAEITSKLPETAIVMLADTPAHPELLDALVGGASGYLAKESDPARLVRAIRATLRGEVALPRNLVAVLVAELRARGGSRLSVRGKPVELTPREWQVLDLLRRRLSTAQIAARLSISPITVRRHVSRIIGKLGAEDRDSAVTLLKQG